MVEKEQEDNGIQIHSLKSDMAELGVLVEEPTEQEGATEGQKPEEDPKQAEEKPKKSRAQRRIERQNRKIKELEAKLEAKDEKKEPEKTKEIDIDDYDSYDDYLEALEDKPKEEKEPEKKADPEPPAVDQEALNDMFEDGNADYKDFNAKVQSDDLAFSPEMLKEVLRMESPSDVAYAIASDPKKAKELAAIKDPHDLTVAIAKIQTVKADSGAEVPKTTKAPKPISPVSGNSTKGLSLDDEDLSFEQHEKLLLDSMTHTRGGFI